MLIKSADDKSERLGLLEALQKSTQLRAGQRTWLRDELYRLRRGIAGERDAAHYLDNYLRDDPDRALLHDLRFEIGADVVQIDHLILTRSLHVFLLETKNFNGNVRINEYGEFSVEYPGERCVGIPSPLEQSRRHEGPLRKLFDTLGIVGRSGRSPQIHHCVLVHPQSLIHRPSGESLDARLVIKADQFRDWHRRFQDEQATVGGVFGALLNIRGSDTIRDFAERLVRQHRPAEPNALPAFVTSRHESAVAAPDATPTTSVRTTGREPSDRAEAKERRKLACARCASKITFAEARFCWQHEQRFGGLQYCRSHQQAF